MIDIVRSRALDTMHVFPSLFERDGIDFALIDQLLACVSHAGLETALESLVAGVPMLAIPIANDQPGVAARIKHPGFGTCLSQRTLKRQAVLSALLDLLKNQNANTS
jgi:UDP:flavonoid glycosyltransferase YjiC (YdhE family)